MTYTEQFTLAKKASRQMATLTTEEKNTALYAIADALEANTEAIILENAKDIAAAEEAGMGVMVDRLLLNAERIKGMAKETRNVASLEDEVGKVIDECVRTNGLKIMRKRVPLGVVGMIYESRPNVTVDATSLALKSGNAVVLKGGKEAIHSNRILSSIMREALRETKIPEEAVQFLDTVDREATAAMLEARGLIDVLIPRGGKGLIRFVNENAKVPAIETGASVVHTYVDKEVNLDESLAIVVNEKMRRPSVCNALDTILVHANVAEDFLSKLAKKLREKDQNVVIHGDERVGKYLGNYPAFEILKDPDYSTEWLDYAMSIRIVEDLDAALEHIHTYSLGHSESICTNNAATAERFLNEVDAACVYWNASTAFSDGAQFGLGAEIGISTQKMHARGPFALEGLTTYKWVIYGAGQTRE